MNLENLFGDALGLNEEDPPCNCGDPRWHIVVAVDGETVVDEMVDTMDPRQDPMAHADRQAARIKEAVDERKMWAITLTCPVCGGGGGIGGVPA